MRTKIPPCQIGSNSTKIIERRFEDFCVADRRLAIATEDMTLFDLDCADVNEDCAKMRQTLVPDSSR